jgi:hypothetical protein
MRRIRRPDWSHARVTWLRTFYYVFVGASLGGLAVWSPLGMPWYARLVCVLWVSVAVLATSTEAV